MSRKWIPWAVGAATVTGGVLGGAAIVRAATGPSCAAIGDGGGTLEGVPYLEAMRGGAAPTERVPLVVLLHAKDGTPNGYIGGMSGIGRARLVVPQGGYAGSGGGFRWFEQGLLATIDEGFTLAELDAWTAATKRLQRFVRAISKCRPTAGAPIVTGSSQGGEAALSLATLHRRSVAGAVAVNGDMPEALWDGKMAPTVMLNGTGDTTVPFAQAQEHADYAAERGAPVQFVAYPSTGHEITTAQGKAWRDAVEAFVTQQSTR